MFHLPPLGCERRCLIWHDTLNGQVGMGANSGIQLERPQTRLFFSVDLVGSTAYKQTEPKWQPKFLSFYREFPQCLANSLREQEAKLPNGTELPKPVFGKRSVTSFCTCVRWRVWHRSGSRLMPGLKHKRNTRGAPLRVRVFKRQKELYSQSLFQVRIAGRHSA